MALFRETADVSVRPAVPGDETAIAAAQLAAWRDTHAGTVSEEVLAHLHPEDLAARWAAAITDPPGPGYRVLVACRGAAVVGFAAVAPVPAPEPAPLAATGGEIVALEVTPHAQRGGHGSRLLAAVVDTLRADGADHVVAWVMDGDDAREGFLRSSGFGPDGAVRELASGPTADPDAPDGSPAVVRRVVEHRWSAAI